MNNERKVALCNLVITNPLLEERKLVGLRKMSVREILRLPKIITYECGESSLHYVLDGNHRVKVLLEMRKGSFLVPVFCDGFVYSEDKISFERMMRY